MRTGYAIRDRKKHGWLKARYRAGDADAPVTVYVRDSEDALLYNSLKDARRMAQVLRRESAAPEAIEVLDPRWKVVG